MILHSYRLRTFEDARLEIVTYVEAKFGFRIRDSKPSDTDLREHSDPLDVGAVYSLSRQAKEKGHWVHEMVVSSAVEHIFNETAMQARTPASNRLAKANRANHGPRVKAQPRVKAKERAKRTMENPQDSPKVPTAHARVKHRKLVSQVLKTRNQRLARKFKNLHKHVPLTIHGFMRDGVLTNGRRLELR